MFRKKMNVLKIEFECFFLFEKKERFFVDLKEFSITTGFDSFGKSWYQATLVASIVSVRILCSVVFLPLLRIHKCIGVIIFHLFGLSGRS